MKIKNSKLFSYSKRRDWISIWLQEIQRIISCTKVECFIEVLWRFVSGSIWIESQSRKRKENQKKEKKNNFEMSSRKWNCLFDNQMHSIIELYIYVITLDFSSPITCVPAFWISFFFFDFLIFVILKQKYIKHEKLLSSLSPS